MAELNQNILFAARPADMMRVAERDAALESVRLSNAMKMGEIGNNLLNQQSVIRENEQEKIKAQAKDMASDAIRLRPLIESGDMKRANVLMAERIAKIQQRGGDPSDTMAFRDALNMGQMDQAGALQELDTVINAGTRLGLIEPDAMSSPAMTEFQRENLRLQQERLNLAKTLTPAQQASINLGQQRVDLASNVDLEERKAEAGAKGRAKGESAAEKQSLAASDAPVLFGEFISAIQQQPETGIGRAYESQVGYVGLGNVEQQRAIAVADTIASQLMAYANKLPGPASDKDRVDFKASIGAYESASNREQRLAAAQQAQRSFMRLVEKYGTKDSGELPPPIPPSQEVFEVDF